MPPATDHERAATMKHLNILLESLPPPPRVVKYIAPVLFVILHMIISFTLSATFFLALFFIFLLGYGFDHQSLALDAHHASLTSVSTLNIEASQRVRERLQTYKSGYEKAIARRDAILTNYIDLQERTKNYQTELLEIMGKRNEEYRQCRRDANESRLVYYKLMEKWQVHIIDELEKLVRKFKNVAMPKVKGVGPRKGKTNSLTSPLEQMVLGLKKGMQITRGEIGVAEKIGKCLNAKTEDMRELYGRVKKAEEVLESVKEKVLGGAGEMSGMERWEEKFEVQMRRLDMYYQGMMKKEEGGEVDEKGEHCTAGATRAGVEVDKV
jgi:hypothetical protein